MRTRLLTHLSNSCHAVLSTGRTSLAHPSFPQPISQFNTTSTDVSHFTPASPEISNFSPTSLDISHFTPISPELSPLVLKDPQPITFATADPATCLLNPTRVQVMPAPLTNETTGPGDLVPSTTAYRTAFCHQFFEPIRTPLATAPVSSASTEAIGNPQAVSTSSNSSSQTSDDSTVWRPW